MIVPANYFLQIVDVDSLPALHIVYPGPLSLKTIQIYASIKLVLKTFSNH